MPLIDLKNKRDENKLCENPDKGWYIHFYDNQLLNYGYKLREDDMLEDFPFLDHIYMRLAWAFLEPKENEYNWEIIDKIIRRYEGKYRFAFRITCKETDDDLPYATPKWVFDAGAEPWVYDREVPETLIWVSDQELPFPSLKISGIMKRKQTSLCPAFFAA